MERAEIAAPYTQHLTIAQIWFKVFFCDGCINKIYKRALMNYFYNSKIKTTLFILSLYLCSSVKLLSMQSPCGTIEDVDLEAQTTGLTRKLSDSESSTELSVTRPSTSPTPVATTPVVKLTDAEQQLLQTLLYKRFSYYCVDV